MPLSEPNGCGFNGCSRYRWLRHVLSAEPRNISDHAPGALYNNTLAQIML